MKAEIKEKMQEMLDAAVADKELAGGSMLIRQGGEEICYLESGMADKEKGEAIRRDHIYRLYSMSKPVTGAAAMILFEQGKLDLAEPVSSYLPAFSGQMVEENGRLEPAQLPGQLSRCIHPAALCAAAARSFALYRSRKESRLHAEAMRTVFTEQYSAVAEALAVLGEQLGRPGEPEPYRSDRVAAFFTSLGSPPLECAVTLDDLGRTHAAVTLPRTRFGPQELAALAREVGRICRRTLETPQVLSCKGMTTLLFSERPVLRAVFGMAGAAAQGEVSGDAVQQFCSPTAAQMILCDGMGTGRPAAVDGNLAAELTARLLKAGIPAELAARLVTVALALKSEEESGATLDLISVDLYTGTARLFKAGAAPGFLVHGGRARAVGDVSLPVGILGGVNGQSRVVHLCAGDYAVLVSDGLLVDGTAWVAKQLELSAAAGEAPAQVAKTLVETARARALRTGRPDDITAAVLRLENGG